jgi:hypothetical protein
MPPFLRVSSLRGTHKWQRESSEKSFTRIRGGYCAFVHDPGRSPQEPHLP